MAHMAGATRTLATKGAIVPTTTYYASLHTTTPGTTGAHEFAGGAYVRVAVTFGTPTTGKAKNHLALTFTGLPAKTLKYVGLWTAATAGTFKWAGHTKLATATHTFVIPTGATFHIAATGITATIA